jgi:hypothetical protein
LDYMCSDNDVYLEAKGKIGNSVSSYSSDSAISGSGYVVDCNSDTMIEVGSCIGDDDIYTLWRRAKSAMTQFRHSVGTA